MADCELTHLPRLDIDVDRARRQHEDYCQALERLDCVVEPLTELPHLPDSVFVEDAAVAFPELAIICRPGAASRRPEVDSVREAIRRHRPVVELEAPACVDGGDVIVSGRDVLVGVTQRSNPSGLSRLAEILEPLGYRVRGVDVRACLHLKTAATALADDCLLINPQWLPEPDQLSGFQTVAIDPQEPFAANIVRVGDRHLYSTSFPLTLGRLKSEGIDPECVDSDELAKAEGALTCCSVLLSDSWSDSWSDSRSDS
jgi:dimethylargininase